jgi:hypothetical protein
MKVRSFLVFVEQGFERLRCYAFAFAGFRTVHTSERNRRVDEKSLPKKQAFGTE